MPPALLQGAGPSRLQDPELAWAPFNEAVLRPGYQGKLHENL